VEWSDVAEKHELSQYEDPLETPQPQPDHFTIGELARQFDISLRALRFYQSKGLLAPQRHGVTRDFSAEDRDRLALILQGKRLGFTLTEIRQLIAARERGRDGGEGLRLSREKCIEQISLLERQRREIDGAIAELRGIYSSMLTNSNEAQPKETPRSLR
jgi:DNA-binding transcriptional MerR regulator